MIELEDTFLVYRGVERDVAALRGLTLRIGTGEHVVVRGPSGSGKSSLVALALGEQRANAGSVVVLGTDVTALVGRRRLDAFRRRIGVVTQASGRRLAPELTVIGNVALPLRLRGCAAGDARSRSLEMLARMNVEALADRRPGSLSGGEAQRVALAAALVAEPEIVIADEPTGELDAANADQVHHLLATWCRDKRATLLVVTHDSAAERIADRVFTIRDGRLGDERRRGEHEPFLVVDEQGWFRLPVAIRAAAGITDRIRTTMTGGGEVVITPDASSPNPVRTPAEPAAHGGAAAAPAAAVAVVRSVSRSVGSAVVLEAFDAVFESSRLTVVTGRSGSGKSTALALLAGQIQPTSGSIERYVPLVSVALAPRDPGFSEADSVVENVRLARRLRGLDDGAEVHGLCAELGLGGLIDRPVSALSGGERQRVAIARALATDCQLVVLDEPTSQLDQSLAASVARLLRRRARLGQTVVCASHDPEVIAAADRLVEL